MNVFQKTRVLTLAAVFLCVFALLICSCSETTAPLTTSSGSTSAFPDPQTEGTDKQTSFAQSQTEGTVDRTPTEATAPTVKTDPTANTAASSAEPSPSTGTPVSTVETPPPSTETPPPSTETPVSTTETPPPSTETPLPPTETPILTTETPSPRVPLDLSGSAVSQTGKAINVRFEYRIVEGEDGHFTVRVTAYLDHYSLYCGKRTSGNNVTVADRVFTYATPGFNFTNEKHETLLYEAETVFAPEELPQELTISACWMFNGTYSGQPIGLIEAKTSVDLTEYAQKPVQTPASEKPFSAVSA